MNTNRARSALLLATLALIAALTLTSAIGAASASVAEDGGNAWSLPAGPAASLEGDGDHAHDGDAPADSGDGHADGGDDHAHDGDAPADSGDGHTDGDGDHAHDGDTPTDPDDGHTGEDGDHAHDDGDDHAHEDGDHPADRTVDVKATEFAFDPIEIHATVGERVKIVLHNAGGALHDITADDFAGTAEGIGGIDHHDSGSGDHPESDFHVAVEAGEMAELMFEASAPGTYELYCSVPGHREAGMVATLVIEAADHDDGHDEPTGDGDGHADDGDDHADDGDDHADDDAGDTVGVPGPPSTGTGTAPDRRDSISSAGLAGVIAATILGAGALGALAVARRRT